MLGEYGGALERSEIGPHPDRLEVVHDSLAQVGEGSVAKATAGVEDADLGEVRSLLDYETGMHSCLESN